MWLNLAAMAGNTDARSIVHIFDARMTPAQIAEAKNLAQE
jgi:hypothetical protein